eukprot:1188322-Rhodomonas_salina.1
MIQSFKIPKKQKPNPESTPPIISPPSSPKSFPEVSPRAPSYSPFSRAGSKESCVSCFSDFSCGDPNQDYPFFKFSWEYESEPESEPEGQEFKHPGGLENILNCWDHFLPAEREYCKRKYEELVKEATRIELLISKVEAELDSETLHAKHTKVEERNSVNCPHAWWWLGHATHSGSSLFHCTFCCWQCPLALTGHTVSVLSPPLI